jgi:hypothetical protein
MTTWLAPIHLALTLVIVTWDVVLAGRIARQRDAPRFFAAITGLGALLLVPALMVQMGTATVITGRGVAATDWIWPLILVVFAIQAVYALLRGLVNPLWGIPIAGYNLTIATVGIVRYGVAHGFTPALPLLAVMSAQSTAMSIVAWSSLAMITPFYLNVPMIAPAYPALRGATAAFRLFMSVVATVWLVAIFGQGINRAFQAFALDRQHVSDRLTARAGGDFHIGLKVLPDIASPPSAAAAQRDFALADETGVTAVAMVIVPGASRLAIDSAARIADRLRGDSAILIVAIGYRGVLLPELGRLPLDAPARLATLEQVVTRLRPDIVLPAEDPYGVGARAHGELPVERWTRFLTDAATVAKRARPGTRVGVSVARFGRPDSSLYAWAAAAGSPIDVVGFTFFPLRLGLSDIGAYQSAADRWMKIAASAKPHWVFAAGGYPLVYGEGSQERAIVNVLAWATARPTVKGVVVYEAGDYGEARGLRAPDGRVRLAARTLARAIRILQESIAP